MDPSTYRPRTICSIEGIDGDVGGSDTPPAIPTDAPKGNGQAGVDVGALAAAVAAAVKAEFSARLEGIEAAQRSAPNTDTINAAVRRAMKGRGESESATPPSTETAPQPKGENGSSVPPPQWQSELEAMRFENKFGKASRGFVLTDRQEAILMAEARREEPDDLHAWVAAAVKDLGWASETSPEPKPVPEAQATPAANGTPAPLVRTPAVSDGGAPTTPPVSIDEIVNPAHYTKDVTARLIAKHGEAAAYKQIRQTAERWYRKVRVTR